MNLVTIKELSEFIKVKPSTIYSWVHNGTIPFIKLNGLLRFDMDEVQEWVKKSSKAVPPNIPKSLKKSSNLDIDSIVKRAVESVRPRRYNAVKRETSLNQGLRKED
ncbi:MAG TPA: helix-turn-helix domain-containing protein [Thermodesulfobacteriota bacterium]